MSFQRTLELARSGDPGGRERLFQQLEPVALRSARKQMGDRVRRFVEPEGIANEALGQVLDSLDALPRDVSRSVLLRRLQRCVRSLVLQEVRRNQRHAGESVVGDGPDGMPPSLPSVGSVTREDLRAWIRRLVSRLPEDHREIVRLCALEELSFVEAARRLSLPTDTVRKRYHRANVLLREAIARRTSCSRA